MRHTSNRLANFHARTLGLDKKGTTRLQRAFRNMIQKGILRSDADPDDERGTRLLSAEEAAIAILLLPLADLAVDARGLRSYADDMRQLGENGASYISAAMQATREGHEVRLVVKLNWRPETAEINRVAFFESDGAEIDPEAAEIIQAMKAERLSLATVTVPASTLLKFFVSDAE